MDEIILKAYADCIAASLTERAGGHLSAAVALGEHNRAGLASGGEVTEQAVKFYWETYNTRLGMTIDRSYKTVIWVNEDGAVCVGDASHEWRPLSREVAQSAADWIVQWESQS